MLAYQVSLCAWCVNPEYRLMYVEVELLKRAMNSVIRHAVCDQVPFAVRRL